MKNTGSNTERRDELLKTIDARLRHMAMYMEEGKPVDFLLPKTMLAFRNMNIPELGIFRISSPSTLNAKQTPKLHDKIEEIQELLDAAKSHCAKKRMKKSLSETNKGLRRTIRMQKLTIAGFARRYQEQESVIESQSRKLKVFHERNSLLTKEVRELRGSKKFGAMRIVDPEES
ncbi:hypothetical protein [Paraburkholderia flava]|uniref:hypothetical protein n=1 Tax=Paraburkholderia flava TaxID=2547393 RepID=UPI00105F35EF|nr:hypothetical protein [Paraburkholderia flava]